ncbi:MAG: hypothetical protein ACM3ML_33340 [Micromonosporaceae bacterium]
MLVAGFIASVYLAGVLADHVGVTFLAGYAALAGHFEVLGYAIVGIFILTWGGAVLLWKLGGFDHRYRYPSPVLAAGPRPGASGRGHAEPDPKP